jgi:curved DNA-binding protein CbpA
VEPFNPYRQWLELAVDRPPDYYTLLSLPAFSDDRQAIAAAAARAATRVRGFKPGPHAREWSRLLDEIREARECLSDPVRKATYDQTLRGAILPPGASADHLLPPVAAPVAVEPPSAMPAAVETQPASPPDDLLPPAALPASAMCPAAPWPAALPADEPTETRTPLAEPATALAAGPAGPPGQVPRGIACAPAVKRRSSSRPARPYGPLVASAALVFLAVIAAAGYAVLSRQERTTTLAENPKLAPARSEPADATTQSPQAVATPAPKRPAKRSKRPRPATPSFDTDSSPAGLNGAPNSRAVSADATPLSAAASLPAPPPAPAAAASPSPATPPDATKPTPAPEPPQVTRAEVQALVKALEAAKAAYEEHRFQAAESHIAKAESLAKLPPHQQAVARLKEAGGYVQEFREAVAAAVAGMKAGTSFKVGTSTQVSFVEGFPDKVILRIAGMNRTYAFSELPPGLALALADFKLPQADPHSRVVKGAYLLMHKRADSETREKAVALWEEAKVAGAAIDHLLPLAHQPVSELLNDVSP